MTEPLKKGDKVAIVSPAKKIDRAYIEKAENLLSSWGFIPVTGRHALDTYHQFAGTDENRAADLQQALDDPEIRAVICARGGYGTVRIIDRIDFSGFAKNPKWITGFSDITVLHNHIHTLLGVPTIHGAVPLYFIDADHNDNPTLSTLRSALTGEKMLYEISGHQVNREGEATGVLVGGNLAILESLIGTNSDIDTSGKILFIEDVSEYAYRLDRMMWSLKKSGKLENLAGLIVGGLTDIKEAKDLFGFTPEEIILNAVKEYSFPVMFGFPAGHVKENRAMVFGVAHQIIAGRERSVFKQL